jgi:type VI protein secretion system component VasK
VRLLARWGVAVAVSACAFAGSWWACQAGLRLDEGVSLGIAGAVLAVVLALAGWWAAREKPAAEHSADRSVRVSQKVRAGRDAHVAGRDQEIRYGRGEK